MSLSAFLGRSLWTVCSLFQLWRYGASLLCFSNIFYAFVKPFFFLNKLCLLGPCAYCPSFFLSFFLSICLSRQLAGWMAAYLPLCLSFRRPTRLICACLCLSISLLLAFFFVSLSSGVCAWRLRIMWYVYVHVSLLDVKASNWSKAGLCRGFGNSCI